MNITSVELRDMALKMAAIVETILEKSLRPETTKKDIFVLENEINSRLIHPSVTPKLLFQCKDSYEDKLYSEYLPVKSLWLNKNRANQITELVVNKYFKLLQEKAGYTAQKV